VRAKSLLPGPLRKVARRVRLLGRRPEPPPIPGLPDGLEQELLADVCRRALGEDPLRTSYRHLSGFKTAGGAYRVYVETTTDRPWTVFYKECRYGRDDAPGLIGHPATLGPPEFTVYGSADPEVRRFLPDVYHREEIEPGVRYRYVLQDVQGAYLKPATPDELLRAVAGLRPLGHALRDWIQRSGEERLIRYDHGMMVEVGAYVEEALHRYATSGPDSNAVRLLPVAEMIEVLSRPQFHDLAEPSGVHGDYNRASVLVGKHPESGMKVVDWEWAGIGLPHIDLAILLERADPDLTSRALQTFARQEPGLSYAEHERLLHWSRLATCLSNAAIMATEVLDGSVATSRDRPAYLRWLLKLATSAYRRL